MDKSSLVDVNPLNKNIFPLFYSKSSNSFSFNPTPLNKKDIFLIFAGFLTFYCLKSLFKL
jgi:hypothetical protein